MGIGHTVEIIDQVYDPSDESADDMSDVTDIAILVIIIALLVAAVFYSYNKCVQTETALALSLKLNNKTALQAMAKDAKDRDRVKEAKDVLRLLEKYERKKKRKTLSEPSSTEHSTEDKKKKKKISEFGRVVLSVTEGGYKIPWVEGSGKLMELGPNMIKSMLEPTKATPLRCAAPKGKA
ncbi:hypothetical protein PENTCL1PPCAC_10350, partial [Pristionchus entomophagus]